MKFGIIDVGGENPLDYPALVRSPAELVIVAAEAETGRPCYFTKADVHQNDYRALMASCCIQVVDRPYCIDNVPYYDGGLADPVPLEKMYQKGWQDAGKLISLYTAQRITQSV